MKIAFIAFDFLNSLFGNLKKNKVSFVRNADASINLGQITSVSNTANNSTFMPAVDSSGRYVFISDSYTKGRATAATATPICWATQGTSDVEFIDLVNRIAERSGSANAFTTKQAALDWALGDGNLMINSNNEVYPAAVVDSLVANIDLGLPDSFLGQPGTNTVSVGTTLLPYNNPGFVATYTNTGQTFRGAPIWRITHQPNTTDRVSRITATDGFGCYHSMGVSLLANTYYMSSIYFKSPEELQFSSTLGFNNTYSNIGGWGNSGTSTSRYNEGDWIRLYTRFYNNSFNGYAARTSNPTLSFVVNTTATTDVNLTYSIPANGSGIANFGTLYGFSGVSPSITNAGGITGLSTGTSAILNHGLNTSTWTKMSTSNIQLKANLPINYYFQVRIPSTGGVNRTIQIRPNMTGLYTAISDSKYWKITYRTGVLNKVYESFWAAPMIEQKTTLYPSEYYTGSLATSGMIKDTTRNSTVTVSAMSFNALAKPTFDGTDDFLTVNAANHHTSLQRSIEMVIRANAQPSSYNPIAVYTNTTSISNAKRIWLGLQSGKFQMHGWGTTDPASTTTIVNGTYYHVVYAYNQSNKTHYLWVNGQLQNNTVNNQAGMTGWSNSSTEQWFLGRDPLASSWTAGAAQYFNGEIPVFRLYNKILTNTEVSDSFNSLRARFNI